LKVTPVSIVAAKMCRKEITMPSLLPRLICLIILLAVLAGCSESITTDDATTTTKFLGTKQVVSGTVYGYADKSLTDVSSGSSPSYLMRATGQFAFVNFSTAKPNNGYVFVATFSDNSQLRAFWAGRESAFADIAVTVDRVEADSSTSLAVSPYDPAATVNINPVTNLAYWLWQNNIQSPYSDHLGNVFLFLSGRFPAYGLGQQNAANDLSSPGLLQLLADINITVAGNGTQFSLSRRVDGQILCTGTFATFPDCI